MSAREKLKFLMLASLVFLPAVAASAAVDGDAETADGNIISATSNLDSGPTSCVDLNADCSTLMVNYYGDSVEFALFRRGSLNDTTYRAHSSDNTPPDSEPHPVTDLSSSEQVTSGNNDHLLGIDFLRGLKDKSADPAFNGEFSAKETGPAGAGGMHDWAFAAATSMDYNFQQANPDGIAVPSDTGEGSLIFWDFEHVYQWEVEENVLDSGGYDLSQIALSDIYLSPKTNSTSDPETVVCELNDRDNCRPLSD